MLLLCVVMLVMVVRVVMLLIVLVLIHEVRESWSCGTEILKRLLERFVISFIIITDKLMGVTLRASWREREMSR